MIFFFCNTAAEYLFTVHCFCFLYTKSRFFSPISLCNRTQSRQSDMQRPLFPTENLQLSAESSHSRQKPDSCDPSDSSVSNLSGWNRLSSGHGDRCQECNRTRRCYPSAGLEVRGGRGLKCCLDKRVCLREGGSVERTRIYSQRVHNCCCCCYCV